MMPISTGGKSRGLPGRYQNTGQVARAKRFIVEEGIAQAFTDHFVACRGALKMGDPLVEE